MACNSPTHTLTPGKPDKTTQYTLHPCPTTTLITPTAQELLQARPLDRHSCLTAAPQQLCCCSAWCIKVRRSWPNLSACILAGPRSSPSVAREGDSNPGLQHEGKALQKQCERW